MINNQFTSKDIASVDVWTYKSRGDSPGSYNVYMDETEQDFEKKIVSNSWRAQYKLTRTLLRTLLSLYHPYVAPMEWKFNRNMYGKPYLIAPRSIKFNLSHTNGMIAIAISNMAEVGVDVENGARPIDYWSIIEDSFCKEEISYVKERPEVLQKEHFYNFWTLKEAYSKAVGMGLLIPFNSFHFLHSEGENIRIKFEDLAQEASSWRFWNRKDKDFHISLAIKSESPNDKIRLREFELSEDIFSAQENIDQMMNNCINIKYL